MKANYIFTSEPNHSIIEKSVKQLQSDINDDFEISQIFFYSSAVVIAANTSYSPEIEKLIDITDDKNIQLGICSAGFIARKLSLSELTQQDFVFKGLGQFIAESNNIDILRQF